MRIMIQLVLAMTLSSYTNAQFSIQERFVEHRFSGEKFSLQIDGKKSKGYTDYKYCQKYNSVVMKNPNNHRLNVAFQWMRQDMSYDSLVFKIKAPVILDHNPVILDIYKGQSWYDHSSEYQPEVYVNEVLIQNYNAPEGPIIDRESVYIYLERNLNQLVKAKEQQICFSFQLPVIEALGYTKLWLAWQYYDDSEECQNFKQCLSYFRSEGPELQPIEYYNGKTYFEEFPQSTIMGLYWTMTVFSLFPFIGQPMIQFFGFIIQVMVNWTTFIQIGKIFSSLGKDYEPEQNEAYSLGNYIVESILFWQTGSWFFTNFYYWSSLVPFVGPALQIIINLWFEQILFD